MTAIVTTVTVHIVDGPDKVHVDTTGRLIEQMSMDEIAEFARAVSVPGTFTQVSVSCSNGNFTLRPVWQDGTWLEDGDPGYDAYVARCEWAWGRAVNA